MNKSTLASILQAANMAGAGWIAVALLLSLASLLLRLRLGGIRNWSFTPVNSFHRTVDPGVPRSTHLYGIHNSFDWSQS